MVSPYQDYLDGKRPLDHTPESVNDDPEEEDRRIKLSRSFHDSHFEDAALKGTVKEVYFAPFAENLRLIFHRRAIDGVYFEEAELFYIIECVAKVLCY